MIDPESARREWADRVSIQSAQMLIIASATTCSDMRGELLDYARRMAEHAKALLPEMVFDWEQTAANDRLHEVSAPLSDVEHDAYPALSSVAL